ncbi:MAG: NAD(P)-binding protein [Candidatus Thermoplasmatota archaeon]|nr:NAD(P)-binding protein [Candidatus Thermoplasmatota archaeon]
MYDVIVVGGGVSGLLSTLVLSRNGKRVLLLEKEEQLGGVCRSYKIDGYTIDTGPHIITRLQHGPLKDLMDDYFTVKPTFVPHGKYWVRLAGKLKPFPWNIRGWAGFSGIPLTDRIRLVKMLYDVAYGAKTNPEDYNISLGEYAGDGFNENTLRFLDCMSYFMTGTSMQETPVARFVDAEKYKMKSREEKVSLIRKIHSLLFKEGAIDQTYPLGGIQTITDSIIASFPDNVDVHTSEQVTAIEKGKQFIVSTDVDSYSAYNVVYSGFASELPSLVKDLPGDYRKNVQNTKVIRSLVIWLGLKDCLFNKLGSEIWVDSEKYCWVVPTSNFDSNLAPRGKQLAGFSFILPDRYDIEKEKKEALNAIYSTIPVLEDAVEFIHFQDLVPEKAAWTVSTEFMGSHSPIDGLYLVGTDTEKKSMGITRASYSVLNLVDALKKDKILQ